MATGNRGGGSVYAQPGVPANQRIQPAAKPAGPTLTSNARTAPLIPGEQPAGIGLFGRVKYYGKPNTGTGFNVAAHLTPRQQQQAAQLRRQNIGGLADVARNVADTVTGYSQVENAIRSAKPGKIAGAVGMQAAGLLPFGRGFEALTGIERAAKIGRTAEEAAAHIDQAAKTALAEGHGIRGTGGVGNAPKLKPGEVTPATGGELGSQVRSALKGTKEGVPGAKEMYAAQKDLQHEARVEKVKAADLAEKQAGGGIAGFRASRAAMRGELPKIVWNNQLRDVNQQTLEEMTRFVQNHPAMQKFERDKTVGALLKMAEGGVPAPHEQRLLERAFGKETAGQLRSISPRDWKTLAVDVLNVPRAVMASADLSAPLRQGLVAGVTHPSLLARNIGPMLKMAKSEDIYQGSMDAIHADPQFPLAAKGGVAFTDLGKSAKQGAAQLGAREEARMSNLAEQIPGIGRIIRGSDRAYVGVLNKMRFDYFKRLVGQAAQQGLDINDEKLLQSIGRVVNTATGRGTVPQMLQDHLATMNAAFFSPRLMASRINLLNPIYYMRLDPFARKEALRQILSLAAYGTTVLELARLAGAKVVTDPTNADFAKARFGNTRIDVLGGFQQYVRLAAQLEQNKITSSTTGKVIPLGAGFAKTSRYDVLVKFLQGKFSPVPSIIVDTLKGQDFTGKPVKWSQLSTYERELGSRMVPFLAQDLHDLYQNSGPSGLLAGPLDLFGMGVQSYKPKQPKGRGGSSRGSDYGGGSSSGGSDYGGGGSSGGSVYAQP